VRFEAGSELGKANLEVFSETLLSLAGQNKNVLAVTGDSRGSGEVEPFAIGVPDQIVEVGIAEQKMLGQSRSSHGDADGPVCEPGNRHRDGSGDYSYSDV
jgi:hypothetical protein